MIVRMATENPAWGYTRIQEALQNLGHRVARSTVAKVLKANGIRAHWGQIAGGRFLHHGGLDSSRADHLLHALRARSPKPTGSRGRRRVAQVWSVRRL